MLFRSAYTTAVMPRVSISYTPTWVEWATAGGVLGYWLMAFTLGVRFLPIFKPEEAEPAQVETAVRHAPASAQA